MTKMIKIKINEKEYEVKEGMNVVEACDAHGIPLERFCYHRYLPVDGNCRTCMVEIDTPRGRVLTIGCNTKVTEGMSIHTNSENAVRAQKASLEFLLLDHPLDCPICDKAGECMLQDNYLAHGRYDYKRIVPRYFKGGKAVDAGDHIVLDQERCILCTRCMRFLDNIPGTSELGIIHRGHESKITTFPGKPISNDYSGNITDICPVGALTLKEFRFKQRVWFLKKTKSICMRCARGCTITIQHNFNKIWRFMPYENPKLNRSWMCDKGRFSFKIYQENRLETAMVNQKEEDFNTLTIELEKILQNTKIEEMAWLIGPCSSNESYYLLKKYFQNVYAWIPPAVGKKDDLLMLAEEYPNQQGIHYFGIPTNMNELYQKIKDKKIKVIHILQINISKYGDLTRDLISNLQNVPIKIFYTSYKDDYVKQTNIVVPIRTHIEENGTYINATSLLQKAEQAFEPSQSEIPSLSLLISQMAYFYGLHKQRYSDSKEIFDEYKNQFEELKSYRFSTLPDTGVELSLPKIADEPFKNKKVDFNIFMEKSKVYSQSKKG